MSHRRRLSYCLSLPLVVSACTQVDTTVQKQGVSSQTRSEDCDVKIFRNDKPKEPYQSLGKIETHIQRNFFLGGGVRLEEGYKELKTKACELGGDAILIDHVIESKAAENTHIHVWATVIKLAR